MTKAVVELLGAAGWLVAFQCVPNTPHRRVVPIPTFEGVSRQRYPDILSTDGSVVRLVEVEVALSNAVADDILLRFSEMVRSLQNQATWLAWRATVARVSGVVLPTNLGTPRLDLVICTPNTGSREDRERLAAAGVTVADFATFVP